MTSARSPMTGHQGGPEFAAIDASRNESAHSIGDKLISGKKVRAAQDNGSQARRKNRVADERGNSDDNVTRRPGQKKPATPMPTMMAEQTKTSGQWRFLAPADPGAKSLPFVEMINSCPALCWPMRLCRARPLGGVRQCFPDAQTMRRRANPRRDLPRTDRDGTDLERIRGTERGRQCRAPDCATDTVTSPGEDSLHRNPPNVDAQ